MNATEITPKSAKSRIDRIKIVSRIFRVLIIVSAILTSLLVLAGWLGWLKILPHGMTVMFSEHQTYAWPYEIPMPVLALASIKFGLFGFCALILCRLLRLYEQGRYFTAQNVAYIRFLGCYLLLDWVVTLLLELQARQAGVFLTQLFVAAGIIFVAWIMDEGRKIQEEQELTV